MEHAPLHSKAKESPRFGATRDGSLVFAWNGPTTRIEIHDATFGVPAEVLNLRREIYVDECAIMRKENVASPNDHSGIHLLARDLATGTLIGCSHMIEAEQSDFPKLSGISPSSLTDAVYGSRSALRPDRRGGSIYPLLMYAGASYYRRFGRKIMVAYMEHGDHPVQRRYRMQLIPHAKTISLVISPEKTLLLEPRFLDIDHANSISFRGLLGEESKVIARQIAVTEIELTVEGWSKQINQSPFWQRARAGTLSRSQYLMLLGQLHRFVRHTTRIIAMAWSKSDSKALQKHFRKHVMEEIDHELIIEADMAYLGADVDYYLNHLPTHPGIRAFNGLQESLLAHRSDPIMYMAVPFAVEGISAFIQDENIIALANVIKAWGVADPRMATRFLASHRDFDGDQGGHWDGTLVMLRQYVRDEQQAREFLSISRSVFDNFGAMLAAVAELPAPTDWKVHSDDHMWDIAPSTGITHGLETTLLT